MIPDALLTKLYDRLNGTSDDVSTAAQELGGGLENYDAADLEDAAAGMNLERCEDCDVWCEAGELADEDPSRFGLCRGCQPAREELP